MVPKLLVLAPGHREGREGRHARIVMVLKLLVMAPRRPANTERVVTYEK